MVITRVTLAEPDSRREKQKHLGEWITRLALPRLWRWRFFNALNIRMSRDGCTGEVKHYRCVESFVLRDTYLSLSGLVWDVVYSWLSGSCDLRLLQNYNQLRIRLSLVHISIRVLGDSGPASSKLLSSLVTSGSVFRPALQSWGHKMSPYCARIEGKKFNDAEKGLHINTQSLHIAANVDEKTEKPPLPVENQVPHTSVPVVLTARNRWILCLLWFNMYRKVFLFITFLNLAGIIIPALHHFPYAQNHLGALALGNFLCAILVRNKLFLRTL